MLVRCCMTFSFFFSFSAVQFLFLQRVIPIARARRPGFDDSSHKRCASHYGRKTRKEEEHDVLSLFVVVVSVVIDMPGLVHSSFMMIMSKQLPHKISYACLQSPSSELPSPRCIIHKGRVAVDCSGMAA
ncbi:hypothetical protein GQ53DRAFT_16039 [Thozetella sp. PMI_491]|nr:hypothetical protein GQ53DRAFT_16039 [Thozetella sp. PMI_491]